MLGLENIHSMQNISYKHKAFIDEYFRCNMNATEAYFNVYSSKNRNNARTSAATLLAKPNIQEEINRRLTEKAMGSDEVLARLSAMARASLLPFIKITDEGFVYFDFSHPDAKEYLFLIKKIKTKRTRRLEGKGESSEVWEDEWVEVELHDSQSALEKIGKYHKMFIDRIDVTTDGNKITQGDSIIVIKHGND